jgi:hypothetical protein
MTFLEDAVKGGNIITGLAIGVGLYLLGPVLRPIVRPAAKALLKAGIAAYEQGRVAFAELNEQLGDVMAEARAELEHEGASPSEHAEPVPAQAGERVRSHRSESKAGSAH